MKIYVFCITFSVNAQNDTLKLISWDSSNPIVPVIKIDEITSANSFTLELNEKGCFHHFNEVIIVNFIRKNEYLVKYTNSKNNRLSNVSIQKNIVIFNKHFKKEMSKRHSCFSTTKTLITLKSNKDTIEFYFENCSSNQNILITPMTALKKALNIKL